MSFLFSSDSWTELYISLRKNAFRTIVTMIGVWWGVMMFITLMGITKGVENWFNQKLGNAVVNSIYIWGQNTSIPYKGFQSGRPITFKQEYGPVLKKQIKEIDQIEFLSTQPAVVTRNFTSKSFVISGNDTQSLKEKKKEIYEGRYLNNNDIDEAKKVVMIAQNMVDQLYNESEPVINSHLNIGKSIFKVIGIFKKSDFDEDIYMPKTTYKKHFNVQNNYQTLWIKVFKNTNIHNVEQKATTLLRSLGNIHPEDHHCFGVANVGDQVRKFVGMQKGMRFLSWVVGIATLIAGIFAIGNILLITVKERTQEIGIRRALGAQPQQIKQQIVFESVVIALLAGILGLISGGFIVMLLAATVSQGPEALIIHPSVSLIIIFGAIVFIAMVASLIGLIPAYRAIAIKPIDALRNE